ncbi:MAG: hypothetical protein QM784_34580 [Polyangiaceae bacterium]
MAAAGIAAIAPLHFTVVDKPMRMPDASTESQERALTAATKPQSIRQIMVPSSSPDRE